MAKMKRVSSQLASISQDTLFYGLAHSASRFIVIFTAPIMTRVFSPSDYGVIDLIATTVSLLTLILSMHVNGGIFREFYEVPEQDRGVLLFSGISPVMLVTLTVDLIAIIYAGKISDLIFSTRIYTNVIQLALIQIPISILFDHFLVLLRFLQRPKVFLLISIIKISIYFICLLIFIVWLRFGIIGVYLTTLASEMLVLMPLLYILSSNYTLKVDTNHIKNVMKYSIPLIPSVFINTYLARASAYFLNAQAGLEHVGLYSIAAKIGSAGLIAAEAFGMAWMPFAYSIIMQREKHHIYDLALRVVFGVYGIIIFSSALFANEVLIIFTTEKYYPSYNLVGFIAMAQIMYYINTMISIGIRISKMTYFITIAQVLGAVAATILFIILIPRYGALGAALSYLIGFSCSSVFIYIFSQRVYSVPYHGIKVVLIYGFIMLSITAVYHLLELSMNLSLQTILIKLIWVILFAMLMFRLTLEKEEIEKVVSFVKGKTE